MDDDVLKRLTAPLGSSKVKQKAPLEDSTTKDRRVQKKGTDTAKKEPSVKLKRWEWEIRIVGDRSCEPTM